jgi:hypothetical protein
LSIDSLKKYKQNLFMGSKELAVKPEEMLMIAARLGLQHHAGLATFIAREGQSLYTYPAPLILKLLIF